MTNALSHRTKVLFSVMITSCLLALLVWCWLSAGYSEAARARIHDSSGHYLGFNEPLTFELIGMILVRTSASAVAKGMSPFSVACMVMQVAALFMLWFRSFRLSQLALYFGIQALLFPQGLIGILVWMSVLVEGPDGEMIDDVAQSPMTTAPWVFASLTITAWLVRCMCRKTARLSESPNSSITLIPSNS